MIFWKKSNNQFIYHFLGFLIELGICFKLNGFLFSALFASLMPLQLMILYVSRNSFFFQNQILSSIFFYSKFGLFILGLFKFFPPISETLQLDKSIQCLLISFAFSVCYKTLLSISFVKTKQDILVCDIKNESTYMGFYPSVAKFIFNTKIPNFMDIIKKILNKNKTENLYVDSFENTLKVLEYLNSKYLNININCLEVGNNNLLKTLFNQHLISVNKQEEKHNFYGARILIISNDYHLILNFLEQSYKLEATSVIVLTDSTVIKEKIKDICKVFLFNNDIKFRELESQYAFDIIFDAYMISSHNFEIYRNIFKEIETIIKNKKAMISLVKKGLYVEDWVFNSVKEILLKKIYDSTYGLTAIIFRHGEFNVQNLYNNNTENIIIFDSVQINTNETIAYSSWKSLWSVEKSTFSILGGISKHIPTIKSLNIVHLLELEKKQKMEYEIFESNNTETYELVNAFFMKYKFNNDNNSAKILADNIIETKKEISFEDIIRAIL